ncbi:hypothetical protein Efla_001897 [Eimeria flavescens]
MATPLLSPPLDKPVLCLSLSPPLYKADGALSESEGHRTDHFRSSVKPALLQALEGTLDCTSIGAVRLSTAYYEQFGPCGMQALADIIDSLPPHVVAIVDGTRGDISNTAAAYARGFFDYFKAGAVTVSSYMGRDAICPFLSHSDAACVFVECRPAGANGLASLKGLNSNTGASLTLYEHVASLCQEVAAAQKGRGELGLLAGVYNPAEAMTIWQLRNSFPAMPFLLDLHCGVSEFFSKLSVLNEPPAAKGKLLICINPPTIQDAPAFAQNAQQQLHSMFPEVFAT